jgi:glycerol-3-phosphate acyltransferase PlsX
VAVTRALTVSIDAMGGDAGPGVVVSALLKTIQRHSDVRFVLHGDEAQLTQLVARHANLKPRCTISHAPDRVSMEDKPSHVLRRGKDTSMWHTIQCVKDGEADVAVSAGNTGALMAVSMFGLGIIEGISRPAIAVLWPTLKGQTVVLDVGANVSATEEQLVDFAVMGEAFAHVLLGLARPTVGILNVGAEEQKGNDGVKGAAQILRNSNLPMAFHGFVEGDDIAKGTVDVVVTDGFSGNIALKTAEGTARFVRQVLRDAFTSSFQAKLGALIARPALRRMGERLDTSLVNGGPLLGLNGIVVKSHGGTDARGFANAIRVALDLVNSDYDKQIERHMKQLAAVLPDAGSGHPAAETAL